MTLALASGETIALAGPTTVRYAFFGDKITTADAFQTLAQGSFAVVATTVYTSTAVQTIVKTALFFNTAGTASTISMYVNGTTASFQVYSAIMPAGGSITYGQDGWRMYDATGALVSSSPITLIGDISGSGNSPVTTTLPVVNAGVGTFGTASRSAAVTANAKGQITGLTDILIAITNAQVSGLGTLATVSNLTGPVTSVGAATAVTNNAITNAMLAQMPATTIKGNNTGGTANAADLTLTQLAAMGIAGLTGWIDVTLQASPVLPGNSAATNSTNMNTILAAAASGSTIYIPKGIYQFSSAWTMTANRMYTFQGQGSSRAGNPPTSFTEIQLTANLAGNFITLPGSAGGWYTQFRDLTFTAAATQTAGAVIDVNGNVGTNIQNCSFQSNNTVAAPTTFWNDVLVGGGGSGSNSWNSAVISNCQMSSYKGVGVRCNSSGSSLVIENCVIQGNWGGFTGTPAANSALAGVSGGFVGAMQIMGCDILGSANNLLLNPVLASSEVCASVFVTNCYFDNSAGSCIKITGTGATVRADFTTCSFTTAGTNYTTGGTALSAVEIGGSFTFAAGGQNISFTACNILNTFGTTGTSNGVLVNGTWADLYFVNCKVSGWTNGYNVTPSGTNISNLKVGFGACGPSSGYALNTTGFNIAAGSYKGLQIQNVNAHGNTTNLTLGAVTVAAADASLFRISDNTGINPRGAVTTPTYPATTVTVTNTTGFRCQVMHKLAATTTTALTLNGVATVVPNVIQTISYVMEPGGTVAIAFTGTAGTWTWVGL